MVPHRPIISRLGARCVGYAASAIIPLFALVGCYEYHDEVFRAESPDSHLEVVVYERNGGATTAFMHDVYLATKGAPLIGVKPVATFYGAYRNGSSAGINVRWAGATQLIIECLGAKIIDRPASTVQIGARQVEVIVKEGIEDPHAPAGGMRNEVHESET
jgi:hypothetical protein